MSDTTTTPTNPLQLHADMHTHTRCSDGILYPHQLVEKAERHGFMALSITDHDNMDAYEVLRRGGYNGPVTLVPGIEVSCFEHGRDTHVLGYYLDEHHAPLKEYITFFRNDRERRATEMVDRLNRINIRISYDEVVDQAGSAPIGRPHVAAVIVKHGYAKHLQQAFDVYLDTGKPGYVAKSGFTIKQAVDMIHAAGGVAVVAHPGRTYNDPRLFLALLATGIDGVEVYHPSHWFVTREYYRVLAKQHDLVITGGSDYHGTRDYDERNFGNFGLPVELFEAVAARARNYPTTS